MGAADGVDEGDGAGAEVFADGAEEAAVMGDADMLEHADGDDAVDRGVPVAVVHQFEADLVFEPGGAGAGAGLFELLGAEGDAGDAGAVVAGEGDGEAAPAGADVQHVEARAVEVELGGDVADFGGLSFLEGFAAGGEVGAGVGAVLVEEEGVEAAVEVVMVGDVAAGAAGEVELLELAGGVAEGAHERVGWGAAAVVEVAHEEFEEVVKAAVGDFELAVHVEFAEIGAGVGDHAALGAAGAEGEGSGLAAVGRVGGAGVGAAVGFEDGEAAVAHHVAEAGFDKEAGGGGWHI